MPHSNSCQAPTKSFITGFLTAVFILMLCVSEWGCSAAGDGGPQTLTVRFAPELEAEGRVAIARIYAATGIMVQEADWGVPVQMAAQILKPDGTPVCGATIVKQDSARGPVNRVLAIHISADREPDEQHKHCQAIGVDLVHEMLHFVIQQPKVHSQSGVFMNGVADDQNIINDSVLETVCGYVDCAWMRAETYPQ